MPGTKYKLSLINKAQITAAARKVLIAADAYLSKTAMAKQMQTSRSALDRLLDPTNTSITLQPLERAAHAIGKRLRIEFA